MPLLTLACSIAFTGKIDGYNKTDLTRHIEAAGGTVAKSASASVDLFLVGARASDKKVEKARALGLTIVEGDLLYELLEKGEVDWDDSPRVRPLDELIADARAIFDGAPSSEAWEAICALADECDDDHIGDLVSYLSPQLDEWPDDGLQWNRKVFATRKMPDEWLLAMIHGERHPKHALAPIVRLPFPSSVNDTLASGLFDNEDLARVRALSIFSSRRKKTFYQAMAASPYLSGVESLEVELAPEGVFSSFASENTFPSLTRLFADTKVKDEFEDMIFGPWAPKLECIGVSWPKDLATIARRIDELPSLEALSITFDYHAQNDPDFERLATFVEPLLEPLRVLTLNVDGMNDEALGQRVLGEVLDAIEVELDELDLRACTPPYLKDKELLDYWTKHLVDNGLGARVGKVFMSPDLPQRAGESLQNAGANVYTSHGERFVVNETPTTMGPAPGEAERIAKHQVHVTDAMMFAEPSARAWDVLTSVVDGLEFQLEPDGLVAAIDTLEDYLEVWPAHLRMCPTRWLDGFLGERPSPKTRLVRGLTVEHEYKDPKGLARMWARLVDSGNLDAIEHVHVAGPSNSKPYMNIVESVMKAAQPSTYGLSFEKYVMDKKIRTFDKALEARGVLPPQPPVFVEPSKPWVDAPEVMSEREVELVVRDPKVLQEIFDRGDLDHVVSLDLTLDLEFDGSDWSGFDVRAVGWGSLRHLGVFLARGFKAETYYAVVEWLSRARPVFVCDDWGRDGGTPMGSMAAEGVYSRAYGSTFRFGNVSTLEAVREVVGREDVHVAYITTSHHPTLELPDLPELVDAMHPSLRRCLRQLSWPLGADSFDRLDAIIDALPSLEGLRISGDEMTKRSDRKPFLKVLASSERAEQLTRLVTRSYSGSFEGLSAAELKIVQKNPSFDAAGWTAIDY